MKNYSISLLRMLCMMSIVTHHVLLYYNLYIAEWFNIAVQLFFIISGFLYGQKKNNYDIKWLKKNYVKLSIPYYIWVLFIVFVTVLFGVKEISICQFLSNIFFIQAFIDGVPNLSHLWFLSYILLCYLLTPLLNRMLTYLRNKRFTVKKTFVSFFVICVVFQLLTLPLAILVKFKMAWIICYILGYLYGAEQKKLSTDISEKKSCIWMTFIFISVCICKFYFERVLYSSCSGIVLDFLTLCVQYFRVVLAFIIAVLFVKFVKTRADKFSWAKKSLDFSDGVCFHIYIVHQVYILGDFSLMRETPYTLLNLSIVAMCILISAFFLKLISDKVCHRYKGEGGCIANDKFTNKDIAVISGAPLDETQKRRT